MECVPDWSQNVVITFDQRSGSRFNTSLVAERECRSLIKDPCLPRLFRLASPRLALDPRVDSRKDLYAKGSRLQKVYRGVEEC